MNESQKNEGIYYDLNFDAYFPIRNKSYNYIYLIIILLLLLIIIIILILTIK